MASYKDAIAWIAREDDTSDVTERGDDPLMTMTMHLVAALRILKRRLERNNGRRDPRKV